MTVGAAEGDNLNTFFLLILKKPKYIQLFLLLTLVSLLAVACAPQEVKPPPQTGEIIAERTRSAYSLNIRYSVGRLDDQLKVVGVIENTYMSDLDHFKLDLTVINLAGVLAAEATTGTIHIAEHGSQAFDFRIPVLHGPHNFKFRYEYDYYDYAETGRSGIVSMRAETHDWSFFEDLIELP